MPSVFRKGDFSVGHDEYPPFEMIEGSENCYCGNQPICRQDIDHFAPHTRRIPPNDTHARSFVTKGSPNVFLNGYPIAREGDPVSCNDKCGPGCERTFIN
ncbi:MAG: PAAR domain-containing protein [Magnetococcus sp. YQC-3]